MASHSRGTLHTRRAHQTCTTRGSTETPKQSTRFHSSLRPRFIKDCRATALSHGWAWALVAVIDNTRCDTECYKSGPLWNAPAALQFYDAILDHTYGTRETHHVILDHTYGTKKRTNCTAACSQQLAPCQPSPSCQSPKLQGRTPSDPQRAPRSQQTTYEHGAHNARGVFQHYCLGECVSPLANNPVSRSGSTVVSARCSAGGARWDVRQDRGTSRIKESLARPEWCHPLARVLDGQHEAGPVTRPLHRTCSIKEIDGIDHIKTTRVHIVRCLLLQRQGYQVTIMHR